MKHFTRPWTSTDPLVLDGRIILKRTCSKWDGEAWTGLSWLRIWTGGGAFECGAKLLVSIKCGKFLY
jgi:hypothetical protein